MITDDRLKELLTVGGANSAPMHEISEMAELILSLRSQKARLIEDSNALAKELGYMLVMYFRQDDTSSQKGLIEKHKALLKEMEV